MSEHPKGMGELVALVIADVEAKVERAMDNLGGIERLLAQVPKPMHTFVNANHVNTGIVEREAIEIKRCIKR
jgi:hypothetical protein